MGKSLTVVKYHFLRTLKMAYIVILIILIVAIVVNIIVETTIGSRNNNSSELYGSYLAVMIILAPVLIAGKHYSKLLNIGARKIDFFKGSLVTYAMLSIGVALLSTLFHYFILPMLPDQKISISIIGAFGWADSTFFVCFIRQVGFYMLVSMILHSLVMFHQTRIGIIVDVLIVAILAVFIPITPLRESLVRFLNTVLLNENVLYMFISNLFLGGILYTSTLYVMARK